MSPTRPAPRLSSSTATSGSTPRPPRKERPLAVAYCFEGEAARLCRSRTYSSSSRACMPSSAARSDVEGAALAGDASAARGLAMERPEGERKRVVVSRNTCVPSPFPPPIRTTRCPHPLP
eukprot:3094444-Rhodomonas_salina.1